MQNVLVLSNYKEQQKLNETLNKPITDISVYKGDYRLFTRFCEERGQRVSGDLLVYYLHSSLTEQRVKKSTFNRRYFACKKMLEEEDVYLTETQLEDIKQLRKHFHTETYAAQAKVKGKSPAPSDELLEAIHQLSSIRARAILFVQFYTGCRPSEMVNLKVKDFDLDNNSVQIYLQKQREIKDKRLPLLCVNEVKAYIKQYHLKEDCYFIGTVDKHHHYRNRKISLSGYNQYLNKIIGLSAYNFRKSLVSHMHNRGASLEIIQKQTGHSSARTIAEHYLKVDNSMVDRFL